MAENNKSLGRLELHGIPPAPRGVPSIEVTFSIDADGIMKTTVKDDGTGRSADLRIMPTSGLSHDEIQQMIDAREQYHGDDSKRKEVALAKNELDGLIYNTSRNFEDFADLLTPEDEDLLQQALDDAEDAMETEDLVAIQDAHDALSEAAQKLGEAIYKQGQGGTPPPSAAPTASIVRSKNQTSLTKTPLTIDQVDSSDLYVGLGVPRGLRKMKSGKPSKPLPDDTRSESRRPAHTRKFQRVTQAYEYLATQKTTLYDRLGPLYNIDKAPPTPDELGRFVTDTIGGIFKVILDRTGHIETTLNFLYQKF